jgi:hypothetical protein
LSIAVLGIVEVLDGPGNFQLRLTRADGANFLVQGAGIQRLFPHPKGGSSGFYWDFHVNWTRLATVSEVFRAINRNGETSYALRLKSFIESLRIILKCTPSMKKPT